MCQVLSVFISKIVQLQAKKFKNRSKFCKRAEKFFISSHFLKHFLLVSRRVFIVGLILDACGIPEAGSRFAARFAAHTRLFDLRCGSWGLHLARSALLAAPPPRTAPRRRMTGWAGNQRPGSGRCAPGRPRTSSSRSPGSTRPHAAMSRVTELSRRLASDILDDSTLSNVLRTSFERSLAQRPRAPPAPHQIFVRWGAHTSAPSTRVRLIICTSAWARGWAQGRQASGQAYGAQMNTVW